MSFTTPIEHVQYTSTILANGKDILYLSIDFSRLSIGSPCLLPPHITKGRIPMVIYGSGIIFWLEHVFVQYCMVLCKYQVGKGITTISVV